LPTSAQATQGHADHDHATLRLSSATSRIVMSAPDLHCHLRHHIAPSLDWRGRFSFRSAAIRRDASPIGPAVTWAARSPPR
jgi:hypothetical protein